LANFRVAVNNAAVVVYGNFREQGSNYCRDRIIAGNVGYFPSRRYIPNSAAVAKGIPVADAI